MPSPIVRVAPADNELTVPIYRLRDTHGDDLGARTVPAVCLEAAEA